MGSETLARLSQLSDAEARQLIAHHKLTLPAFWRWSDAVENQALLDRRLSSVFGWQVSLNDVSNPRFLRNFPMQANGAEMLRLACCLSTERGINVCATLHDALLIEATEAEILEFVTFAALFGSAAVAQTMRENFGELELSIDVKSWRIERPSQHILNVLPIGTMAKTGRPVVITQAASKDLRDCEILARAQLPDSLYDEPKGREVEVGGLAAVAVHAHTRCRNAMPTGIAICIPHRGIGYVLTNRIVGCRTDVGNPFSGSDWFEDLTKGIRFAP